MLHTAALPPPPPPLGAPSRIAMHTFFLCPKTLSHPRPFIHGARRAGSECSARLPACAPPPGRGTGLRRARWMPRQAPAPASATRRGRGVGVPPPVPPLGHGTGAGVSAGRQPGGGAGGAARRPGFGAASGGGPLGAALPAAMRGFLGVFAQASVHSWPRRMESCAVL